LVLATVHVRDSFARRKAMVVAEGLSVTTVRTSYSLANDVRTASLSGFRRYLSWLLAAYVSIMRTPRPRNLQEVAMRRLLSGIMAVALFAAFVASVPAEARGSRGGGGFHGAHFSRSGGGYRGGHAGAWRGGGYRGVRPGYGYGASVYPGYDQDYGWGGYGDGGWWGPVAAASMILPFAAAAAQADYADGSLGDYCVTPARTCELDSAGRLGAGCSCKVRGGRAHGMVE
jgi:hypothetical protein